MTAGVGGWYKATSGERKVRGRSVGSTGDGGREGRKTALVFCCRARDVTGRLCLEERKDW